MPPVCWGHALQRPAAQRNSASGPRELSTLPAPAVGFCRQHLFCLRTQPGKRLGLHSGFCKSSPGHGPRMDSARTGNLGIPASGFPGLGPAGRRLPPPEPFCLRGAMGWLGPPLGQPEGARKGSGHRRCKSAPGPPHRPWRLQALGRPQGARHSIDVLRQSGHGPCPGGYDTESLRGVLAPSIHRCPGAQGHPQLHGLWRGPRSARQNLHPLWLSPGPHFRPLARGKYSDPAPDIG